MNPKNTKTPYPDVFQQANLPEIEESILEFWKADGTFQSSIDSRAAGSNEYVFYDGPPFANGLPHYGHLLTGFVKDAIPRFETMKGRRVERRFGWDCHGLPAEVQAEKELNLTGRAGISNLGIGQFNDYCKKLVLRTADAWEHFVTRQARWVDFQDDYKTMDVSYMESVIWAFKKLWEKGLIYEGYRVLPYCWECETPLSNFETRQDDSYRERQDPAVTVKFALDKASSNRLLASIEQSASLEPQETIVHLLVWTTTPWTLPSNLALAVGSEIRYSVISLSSELNSNKEVWIIATNALEAYNSKLPDHEVIGTIQGSSLIGLRYIPIFEYFKDHPGSFVVLSGDFVGEDEGTGIVHLAPGFGEDDQKVCEENNIEVVCPVDDRGCFDNQVPDLSGIQVFDANPRVIKDLKSRNIVVTHDSYLHQYPHCWRTDTPLIYRAMSSWFVEVTAIKDRMFELNQQINWIPSHVRDGSFGKWLQGARDWSISRNRFWGAPIPVWKSDNPEFPRIDVYGSLEELERDFSVKLSDLHRPAIDELVRPNPDDPSGLSMMRRVPDVLDCWFESGSMPFAQLHYPFENIEKFESHFPADFIVEYTAQTRGWFYTLHVLATALFDKPPFLNCIAHGVVLGSDGRKLSKRLNNYPDPEEVFNSLGADAMRWFLLSSQILRGNDLVVERAAIVESIRQVINPIWNAWYFFTLYANTDGIRARFRTDQQGVLDRYILSKCENLIQQVTAHLDAYDIPGAAAQIVAFMDALNNWYIRRSRDRFWMPIESEFKSDKIDAFDTLYSVLVTTLKVAAPLLPLISEHIYKGLTSERSVHLTDWPAIGTIGSDLALVSAMDKIREICSLAHSVRKANRLRSRLPLPSIVIATRDSESLISFKELIEDEINVKEVIFTQSLEDYSREKVAVVPSVIGPKLGPKTQHVINAIKRGEWELVDSMLVTEPATLSPGEYDIMLEPKDPTNSRSLFDDQGVIVLDLHLSDALVNEGKARDIVRVVQTARRDIGLHVADRINLSIKIDSEIANQLTDFASHIASETLASKLEFIDRNSSQHDSNPACGSGVLDDEIPFEVFIDKAS